MTSPIRSSRSHAAHVPPTHPEAARKSTRTTHATHTKKADGFDGVLGQSELGTAAEGELKSWATSFDPTHMVSGTLQPFDILKEVQSGDVNLTLPMNKGSLAGGLVGVRAGTVMKLSAKAVNGKVNPSDIHVTFQPPLDGPLWTSVPGAYVTSDGDIKVDVSGAPDLTIGPRLPRDLGALADTLNGVVKSGKIGFDLFGIPLGSVGMDQGSGLVQLDKVGLSVKNASFNGNTISLGQAGQLALGKDSTLDIQGSLSDLSVKGHVDVTKLALKQDGVELQGGAGSADLDLHLGMNADGIGKVQASLTHLDVDCQHAVTTRKNGDFISLASGQLQDGSIQLEQDFKLDKKAGKIVSTGSQLTRLDVSKFQGTIEGGQLTVPDEKGTAQIKLGQSTMSGDLHVTPDQILLDGTLDGHAELVDYQGKERGQQVDVKDLELDGKGEVKLDSKGGLQLDKGAFSEALVLNGAHMNLPGLLDFNLAPGAEVSSTITDASLGKDGISADFAPGTHVSGGLTSGSITLPVLGAVKLGKGSTLSLDCDSLSYTSGGLPAASGKMSLTAEVDAGAVDLSKLKTIPGIDITKVDGTKLTLHIDIGRFTLAKDGTFSLKDVQFGVSGSLGDVNGKVTPLPQA